MNIYFTEEGLVFEDMSEADKKAVELADMFFETYGYNVSVSGCNYKGEKHDDGKRSVDVTRVYRRNGTDKDVNVDISVYTWKYDETTGVTMGKRIEKVRMAVDASERVKANRIKKIVEAYEEANK